LGGGIESETTLEIIGSMAMGKTQICLTLAVLAQQPIEQGGLNGEVAFIDSEDTFVPNRIIEICKSRGIDPIVTLDKIHHGAAMNVNHQQLLIEQLYDLCPTHNIKLVIVDSIIGHLRSEYIGRGTLSDRQGLLNKMLHTLSKIALSTKVTVVYTNQVLADPSIQYGPPSSKEKPTGGFVMGHSASNRLHLRKGRQNIRIASLIDSLSLPPGEAPFMITERGIEDILSNKEEKEDE
jgi:DNA repair protein RadA